MKRNCNNCVFAQTNHCGLKGFIDPAKMPNDNCSAWNSDLPHGFRLQKDGYFAWVNNNGPSKTWEEFCERNDFGGAEYYLNPNESEVKVTSTAACVRCPSDVGYFDKKEDAEGIMAMIQLNRLHDEWITHYGYFDTTDSQCIANQYYWSIWYNSATGFTVSHFAYYRFLSFPTKEMATEFLECFRELIEKAKKFI